VPGFELILRRNRVRGNTEDLGAGFAEGRLEAGEVDCLFGAAGSVRSRLKIEDELAPGKIGKRNGAAAVAGERERRRRRVDAELAGHMPSFRRFPRGILDGDNTRAGERGRSALAISAQSASMGEVPTGDAASRAGGAFQSETTRKS